MRVKRNLLYFISILWLFVSMPAFSQPVKFTSILKEPGASSGSSNPSINPVKITSAGGKSRLVSLDIQNMDITEVLKIISDASGWTILCTPQVRGNVTLWIKNITVEQLLDKLTLVNGFVYTKEGSTITVMTQDEYAKQFGKIKKTFEIKYGLVKEISALLKEIASPSGKVLPDPKTNKIIVLDTKENIAAIEEVIAQLDKENRIVTKTFAPQYVKVKDLKEILTKFISETGVVQADETTNQIVVSDTEQNIERINSIMAEIDQQRFETASFQLNYALAKEIKPKLAGLIEKDEGWIEVDERSNKVVVSVLPDKLEKIKNTIESLDEKYKEVLIEARIMAIDSHLLKKLGVEWSAAGSKNLLISGDLTQEFTSTSSFTFQIGALAENDYSVIVKALEAENSTDLLSNPRVLAVNDQEATFKVVTEQPYRTITLVPQTGVQYEEVKFASIGVTLIVTPHIHEDGYISMKINSEVTSLVGTTDKVPVVEKRETASTVMVKDGDTAVGGGLLWEEKQTDKRKVPILGDIPLIGNLFRSKGDTKSKKELIIFITPHVVQWDETAKAEKGESSGSLSDISTSDSVEEK